DRRVQLLLPQLAAHGVDDGLRVAGPSHRAWPRRELRQIHFAVVIRMRLVDLLENRFTLRESRKDETGDDEHDPAACGYQTLPPRSWPELYGTLYPVPSAQYLVHDETDFDETKFCEILEDDFLCVLCGLLFRNDLQYDSRGVCLVVIDANVGFSHLVRNLLQFTGLQVAGEVWKKAGRNLNADPVSFAKRVAGDQVRELKFVDLAALEQLPASLEIAIAGSQNIESRTHNIQSSSVGCDIQQAYPQVHIAAVTRDEHVRLNRPGDFQILPERRRIERSNVFTPGQLAVVVCARHLVAIGDRALRFRNQDTESAATLRRSSRQFIQSCASFCGRCGHIQVVGRFCRGRRP